MSKKRKRNKKLEINGWTIGEVLTFNNNCLDLDFGLTRKETKRRKITKSPEKQSKFIGVSWNAINNRWRVVVAHPEGNRVLGIIPYHLEITAAEFHDRGCEKSNLVRRNFTSAREYRQELKQFQRDVPACYANQNVALITKWGQRLFTTKELNTLFGNDIKVRFTK